MQLEKLILKEARESGLNVTLNGRHADALSAMRSPQFAEGIVKLGLTGLNLAANNIVTETDIVKDPETMKYLVRFALKAAPRDQGDMNTIDVEKLMSLNAETDRVFGKVPVDPMLVRRLQNLAQREISMQELSVTSPGA
jgi:hypothetical protein